jgi:hypothetical protein
VAYRTQGNTYISWLVIKNIIKGTNEEPEGDGGLEFFMFPGTPPGTSSTSSRSETLKPCPLDLLIESLHLGMVDYITGHWRSIQHSVPSLSWRVGDGAENSNPPVMPWLFW